MRVLIIIAHPQAGSFSHKIASAYQEGAVAAGHRVQLVDLYRSQMQLGFLKPEPKAEFEKTHAVRTAFQEMVYDSDELVFIHPLWWGGPPAILKNFIDQVFTPGFAYRHAKKKSMLPERLNIVPERLLGGREVRLFITCDGQRWTNALRLMPYLSTWQYYIFRYTGLKLASFHLFDYMRRRDDLTKSKWLAKVRTIASSKPALPV
ncbi:hypothetical protein CYG49_00540 [Candidatus Saccharibacteria bacterium]|nr:MAG: hypothetical protein CYG49_00540 [Candidatus Saccharibacteria bacterium]